MAHVGADIVEGWSCTRLDNGSEEDGFCLFWVFCIFFFFLGVGEGFFFCICLFHHTRVKAAMGYVRTDIVEGYSCTRLGNGSEEDGFCRSW